MTAAWPASRSRSIARDQRRRLHRGDQVREEPLLGGFEGRARGGLGLGVQRAALAGDVGGLQRRVEIVVDDLEGAGIGVVDADLLGRERVLDQLVLDALVGERARGIEAERLEIAGEHFHGGDAAGLDRLHELGARGEREILAAPQAEPLGIGEIVDRGRAGRGDIDDARIGQRVLQAQAGAALLRGRLIAALALAAGGVRHGVAFVEDDDSIEVRSQPIDDLLDARNSFLARVGAQRGVGRKKDALLQPDRRALAEAGERRDQQPLLPERRPVALRILDQLVGLARSRRRGGGPSASCRGGCRRPGGPCRRRCRRPASSRGGSARRSRRRPARPRRHRRSRRRSTIRRDGRHGPRRHR